MWIADAARSREIDKRAADEFGIAPVVLMERAGLAVFDAIRELLPDRGSVSVVCGKGNNGGDGFVVARLLAEHGFHVELLVAADEAELRPDARNQLEIVKTVGVLPIFVGDPRWARRLDCLGCRDLVVDAMLGTGSKGTVQGPILEAILGINRSGVPVVAVDLPSGIDTDTGEELGESVWAIRTVTFGMPKPFLFQGLGLEHSGYWSVADIGFPRPLLEEPSEARLIDEHFVGNLIPARLRASHKGDNGHALIVAGSHRMPGAAVLAARAALRAGAGLVTVASVPSVCASVSAQLPEVLVLPLEETDGVISPSNAGRLREYAARCQAAAFGPGMTHGPAILDFLTQVWSAWDLPTCVDADALNAVSLGLELPNADCILTPHPGELSRLLQSSVAELQSDRFRSVRQAVGQYGQTVLLKGPYSIVGAPFQAMNVNATGNPGMACAGMGDVLTGIITALMSQDLPPYLAGTCGMFWHGLAGDQCAREIGPAGFLASEVADAVPRARAKLVATCCKDSPESRCSPCS